MNPERYHPNQNAGECGIARHDRFEPHLPGASQVCRVGTRRRRSLLSHRNQRFSGKDEVLFGTLQNQCMIQSHTVGIENGKQCVGFILWQALQTRPIHKLQILHAAFKGTENDIEQRTLFSNPTIPHAEFRIGELLVSTFSEEMLDAAETLEGTPVTLTPVADQEHSQILAVALAFQPLVLESLIQTRVINAITCMQVAIKRHGSPSKKRGATLLLGGLSSDCPQRERTSRGRSTQQQQR